MPKVMAQASGGGRHQRGRRVTTSLAEINVIPLVDVMLVLLIVFMVAAPMLQKGVEVNLPVAARAARMNDTRLYVTVPLSYRTDKRVFLDDESIPLTALSERMRQAMARAEEREVFLRGDGGVQLNEITEVMDRLKAGGVERVGILTQPAPARGR
ncbi:MAG: biopolymer transporter ExbD [Vicinamibacterales bacterium]